MLKIALITHCTSDKILNTENYLDLTKSQSNKNQKYYTELWNDNLRKSEKLSQKTDAINLYRGRMFLKLKECWKDLGQLAENFYIVSAGLGLVSGDKKVPSYGLTVAGGSNQSIVDKVGVDFSYSDWWANLKLNSDYSCKNFFETFNKYDYIFANLTSTYIPLVVQDFNLLDSSLKLIVGDQTRALSHGINKNLLVPYTEALDGPDSIKNYKDKGYKNMGGPKKDFSQRSLLDFLLRLSENGLSNNLSKTELDKIIKITIDEISNDMEKWQSPKKHKNIKYSDKEILNYINSITENEYKGELKPSRFLLGHFRNKRNIACEEKRFKKIYNEFKENFRNKNQQQLFNSK